MKFNIIKIGIFITALAGCSILFAFAGQQEGEQEPYDEDTYGPEEPIVWQKPVAGVSFSHKSHTMEAGLDCESCHDDLFEQEAGAVEENEDFTMAAFAEGKYCGACHNDDMAFDANSKDECITCHVPPPNLYFSKPVKAVVFDHILHTSFGLDCASCHDELFKMAKGNAEKNEHAFTMEALYDGQYCGACHNGNLAFASNTKCTSCHIGVMGYERLMGKPAGEASHGEKKH